ncbi:MAG TPA: hypothetical protein VGA53_05110 [Candidatus Paceibacterota bacterium]
MLQDFKPEIRLFLGIVFVAVIIISSGVLVWGISQREGLKKEVEEKSREVEAIEQHVKALEERHVNTQQEISFLKKETRAQQQIEEGLQNILERLTGSQQKEYQLPLFRTEERFIEIIRPGAQETLCFGEPYTIEWNWKGIEKVSIKMESGTGIYTIKNTHSSEEGKYQWRIGDVDFGFVRPEAWYKIRMFSFDEGVVTADTSDDFLISSCKG